MKKIIIFSWYVESDKQNWKIYIWNDKQIKLKEKLIYLSTYIKKLYSKYFLTPNLLNFFF